MRLRKLFLFFGLCFLTAKQLKSGDRKIKTEDGIARIKVYVWHDAVKGSIIETPIDWRCSTFHLRKDVDSFDLTMYSEDVRKIVAHPMKKTDWESVDTRAKLFIWFRSGKVDTVCLCYLPELMLNKTVYRSDSPIAYSPYDSLISLLKRKMRK